MILTDQRKRKFQTFCVPSTALNKHNSLSTLKRQESIENLQFYLGSDDMKRESVRTQYATHEAKELLRVRNSFSFRLILTIGNLIKNPLRVLLLPFTIVKELVSRNPNPDLSIEPSDDSIVIVGVDTKGTVWSERARKLALELQRFDSNLHISLLTCLLYTSPSPRD